MYITLSSYTCMQSYWKWNTVDEVDMGMRLKNALQVPSDALNEDGICLSLLWQRLVRCSGHGHSFVQDYSTISCCGWHPLQSFKAPCAFLSDAHHSLNQSRNWFYNIQPGSVEYSHSIMHHNLAFLRPELNTIYTRVQSNNSTPLTVWTQQK